MYIIKLEVIDLIDYLKEQEIVEGDIEITERFIGEVRESLKVFISKKVEDKITTDGIIGQLLADPEGIFDYVNIMTGHRHCKSRVVETDDEVKLIIKLVG